MIRRAETSNWEAYRAIRLRSLREEPAAYEYRVSAEQLRRRRISHRAPSIVSNRRSSVTALMVSVCLQPR
jgi:hypothetical protein